MAPPRHPSRWIEMARGAGYFVMLGLAVLVAGWMLAAAFTWIMS